MSLRQLNMAVVLYIVHDTQHGSALPQCTVRWHVGYHGPCEVPLQASYFEWFAASIVLSLE